MENLDQKIEQYLLGELPKDHTVAFEKALATDNLLAQSVVKHREIMKRLEALRVRKKVKMALGESVVNHSNRIKGGAVWGLFAAILTILGVLWYFQQKPAAVIPIKEDTPSSSQPPTEVAEQQDAIQPTVLPPAKESVQPSNSNYPRQLALARTYYQPPATTFIRDAATTLNTSDTKTVFALAAEAFEKGNFATSARLLLPDSTVEQDESARFLRANSRFNIRQYEGAAADFSALHDSFQFKHDARWNFLLCQLAQGDIKAVQALLLKMTTEQDSPFYKNAVELKSKLNF